MAGLAAGDIIASRYRVRSLGPRGAAIASSLRHDTDVALAFQEGWTDDARGREAFACSARRLMAIRHDHLVTHLDHGWCETRGPFVVTEQLGRPLPARAATIPMPALGHIAAQLCAVLDVLHGADVLHHALSWRSVVLDPTPEDPWRVRLKDFCLVPPVAPGEPGILAGNPLTMAPEVVAGRLADGRADQYGLAVLLWEALEGAPPFQAAELYALLRLHTTAPLPPLRAGRERSGQVPGLEAVLRRALSKDPADRFESIGDLHAALCGVWGVSPRPRAHWHPSPPLSDAAARVVRDRPDAGADADPTVRAAPGERGRVPAADASGAARRQPPPASPSAAPGPTVDLRGADLLLGADVAPPDQPVRQRGFELATLLEEAPALPSLARPSSAAPASGAARSSVVASPPASSPRLRESAWSRAPRWTRVAIAVGLACWLAAGVVALARAVTGDS